MRPPIDFYFDFSSPYSYIANEWVDALAARHGRTVRRHAILLGVAFAAAELRSPVAYPIKRDYVLRDFARSARFEGLPYAQPDVFPVASQLAARIFWWQLAVAGEAAGAHWARSAFRAYFTRGSLLSDMAVLRGVAQDAGLDADAAEAASNHPEYKDALRRANAQALAAGVFGAPYFVVDGEPFWGNDRKAQIERTLERGPMQV